MEYTQNYKLKKPGQEDFYNVDDFNSNADIIDQKLKEIEDKTKNIVTSVNGKTGDVELSAEDVGAETPTGAQEKAAAALEAAKQYTDQVLESHKNESASLDNLGHVKHAILTATLDTNWSGSAAPYTKTITVSGIQATDTPIIDVVMSGDFSTDEKRIEAWSYIYRAVANENSITFYATDKPAVELPIKLKVVR